MNNIHIETKNSPNPYNEEPVHYCKQCLSLRVLKVAGEEDTVYCDICGSTDINSSSITDWENLYKTKYGFNYLKNKY